MSEPKKTMTVFSHRGWIGAESLAPADGGKYLNDITAGGQMGVVVDVADTVITTEAADLIRNGTRETGSFNSLMLTKHDDGTGPSIGFMGFNLHCIPAGEPMMGRDCDVSVLESIDVDDDIEISEEFKQFVDAEIDGTAPPEEE